MKQKYRQLKSNLKSTTVAPKPTLRQVTNITEGKEEVYLNQVPFEIPEFDRITQSKLENYYLILMIIEENLREYLQIKESLNEVPHHFHKIRLQVK
jgi:hypothetical protein